MLPLRLSLLIYNVLLLPGLIFLIPGALVKMRRRGGRWSDFAQRLGVLSAERSEKISSLPKTGPRLWIHAVSVGEVGIARKLIEKLLSSRDDLSIVLTTTTPTGQAQALACEAKHPTRVAVLLNPIDFRPVVRKMLRQIAPTKLVLIEAEVWPNLVTMAKAQGIPTILANARLSYRSEKRYHQFGAVVKPIFAQLASVLTQEEEDSERWASLGPAKAAIQMTGSIKFDPDEAPISKAQLEDLSEVLRRAGLPPGSQLLLAASTHPGEEKELARVFLDLQRQVPDLGFLLAPRHVERADDVERDLIEVGLPCLRRSTVTISGHHDQPPTPCLLIDTTGELRAWQTFARVVIVGKSFLARGGQNPAEAVMSGAAVVFGPNMENFDALVRALLKHGGACQVKDLSELADACSELINQPELRVRMIENGLLALRCHQGATDRTVAVILGS